MLKTHYRQPIDWTVKGIDESLNTWNRLAATGVRDMQTPTTLRSRVSAMRCRMI